MEHPLVGQQEGEVGLGATLDGGLLAVVDALTHARGAQHVLGHPLAPLTPGLRARQRLTQGLGGLGQPLLLAGGRLEALDELAMLLGPLLLELGDEHPKLAELRVHGGDLLAEVLRHAADPLADHLGQSAHLLRDQLVDRVDLGLQRGHDGAELLVDALLGTVEAEIDGLTTVLELGGAGLEPAVEALTRNRDHLLHHPIDLSVLAGREFLREPGDGGTLHVTASARHHHADPEAQGGGENDGDQHGDHENGFHASNATKGV